MSTTLAPTAPAVARSVPWTVAWALVAAGAAALLWVLAVDVWPKRPEMGDRFLVPIASVVLAYYLRPRWRSTPAVPAAGGLAFVALGALAFPPAWFLLVQVGARTPLLWWLAAALAAATVGLAAAGHGWRRAGALLFPILFAFFALPTPDVLQSRLLPWLKDATTAGAAWVLPWLGVPAVRAGYTLRLPTGQLGVVDACSGALSLTSLIAISVLTGYVRVVFRRDFSPGRAVALVGLTVPIVVLSNTVRVIVTGVLRHYVGEEAIQGVWHEALGYLVILVGFGMIVGTSQRLALPTARRDEPTKADAPGLGTIAVPRLSPILAIALLAPAGLACVWAEQSREHHREVANLADVGASLAGWDRTDLPVPPDVREVLKCDQMLLREYEDHVGTRVQVYLMFWSTPASTAHIHHPDVCWPARGCTLTAGRVRPVRYAADRAPLAISVRHYDDPDGRREVVLYWTQNGSTVLPDGQERLDRSSEYEWVTNLLIGGQKPERVSRVSVLLAGQVPVGRPEEFEGRMQSLAALIAADLYRACPWAAPPD